MESEIRTLLERIETAIGLNTKAQNRIADEIAAIRELQSAWRQENIRNTQTAQAWHQEDVLRAELRDQMSQQQNNEERH